MPDQNFIGGDVGRRPRRGDRRGPEPGDRRGASPRCRVRAGRPTSTPRSTRPQAAFDEWRHDDAAGAQRDAARGRRRDRGRPRHHQAARDGELRQAGRRSSSSRWTSPSTTGASSPAAPASSRAGPPASTSRTTRRTCAATRSASSASIAPWNYPLNMATWKLGPALAAGNTVVLKPSELTPLTALRLAEITADILPPGVLNVVTGQGETAGDALVRHPEVAMVSLTGDVATGKLIARTAAETLKRVHLELGGKAPVIVFDDADIEAVGRDPHRDGVLQLGPGLHRAVPRDRRARGVRRPRRAASPTRVGQIVDRRPVRRGHRDGPGHLGRPARPRAAGMVDRAVEAGAEVTVGGARARPARLLLRAVGRGRTRPRTARSCSARCSARSSSVQRFADEDAGARVGERRRLRPLRERVDHATSAGRCA